MTCNWLQLAIKIRLATLMEAIFLLRAYRHHAAALWCQCTLGDHADAADSAIPATFKDLPGHHSRPTSSITATAC